MSKNQELTVDRIRRRRAVIVLALACVLAVPAAVAFACSPQAYLRLDRSAYVAGGQMQVSGAFFNSRAQLTISSEPSATDGAVTASSNGSFTTQIPVPSTPGSYTISAVGYESDGSVTNGLPARASFDVTPAPTQPTGSASPPPAGTTQPGAQTQPGSQPQPGATQPTSRPGTARPTPGRFAEPSVPAARPFSSTPTSPRGRSGAGHQPATRGHVRAGRPADAVNTGSGVIERAGRGFFAGSVARQARVAAVASPAGRSVAVASPAGRSAAAQGAPGTKGAATPTRSPVADRSAVGDLWSGFGSAKAPSLVPQATDAAPADGGAGSQLTWGVGLLALGLLALASGLGVAEVRRRRAHAR